MSLEHWHLLIYAPLAPLITAHIIALSWYNDNLPVICIRKTFFRCWQMSCLACEANIFNHSKYIIACPYYFYPSYITWHCHFLSHRPQWLWKSFESSWSINGYRHEQDDLTVIIIIIEGLRHENAVITIHSLIALHYVGFSFSYALMYTDYILIALLSLA